MIEDPNALEKFDNNNILIPLTVINELDGLRNSPNGRGVNARKAIRNIEKIMNSSKEIIDIPIGNGKISFLQDKHTGSNDDSIIEFAKLNDSVLVTMDVGMRVKAAIAGVKAEEYKNIKVEEKLYTGFYDDVIEVNKDVYADEVEAPDFLLPNCGAYVKYDGIPKILCREKNGLLKVVGQYKRGISNIRPLSDEQKLAFDLLTDPDISLVSLTGSLGSGKTLLSIACALDALANKEIQNIVLLKPLVPIQGIEIGYLPGDKTEKLRNWMGGFFDNAKMLSFSSKNGSYKLDVEQLLYDGVIELDAISFMRGRSLSYSYIILDEAQGISKHELKTVLSRVAIGSKIVLCSDLNQIDAKYLDKETSGAAIAISAMKNSPLTAVVNFTKTHRSPISELVSERL